MRKIYICSKMKWTSEEYENQPEEFVNGIMTMWNAEAYASKKVLKNLKQKNKWQLRKLWSSY